MTEKDRARFLTAFERLCLVHEKRLDGESFVKLCEAYWIAMARMDVNVFERVIERAIEETDRFPRPNSLWGISKTLKNEQIYRVAQSGEPELDVLTRFANRVMFRWLWKRILKGGRGELPAKTLEAVIAMKARELGFLRALVEERDPEATSGRFIDRFEAEADRIAGVSA